jgi:hypothetical protein
MTVLEYYYPKYGVGSPLKHEHVYVCACVCVCVYIYTHTHIYMYIYLSDYMTFHLRRQCRRNLKSQNNADHHRGLIKHSNLEFQAWIDFPEV